MRIKFKIDYALTITGANNQTFKTQYIRGDIVKNVTVTNDCGSYDVVFADGNIAKSCSANLFEIFSSDD